MNQQTVSFNINYDSLFSPLSIDRSSMRDPSFFVVADRFFSFADKHDFKFTIFIVGKDLENPEVAARVRSWSMAGHEIGNHSLTHNPNLGSLPIAEMEYEIVRSHELIAQCTGKEPRGFISPSWSTSPTLVELLINNNYLYDTSIFPSYFQYLVFLKLMFLTKKKHKGFNVSYKLRRDNKVFLFAPREPYFLRPDSLIKEHHDGLLTIPVPVVTPLRIPCWHTMYFIFGRQITSWLIKRALKEYDDFYYLFHPMDLLNYDQDLPDGFAKKYEHELTAFERLDVPYDIKEKYAKEAIEMICQSGRRFVTLEEMARDIGSRRVAAAL